MADWNSRQADGAEAVRSRPAVPECRYDGSPLAFRGPRRRLSRAYVAALGGCTTHGGSVDRPWPALLERGIGIPVVNLGVRHAGPAIFAQDDAVMEICANARMTVIEVPGAARLTNRFYTVHPYRNDRVVATAQALRAAFPDVAFTRIHYVGHLMQSLEDASPASFETVQGELRAVWLDRMVSLVSRVPGRKILLWTGGRNRQDSLRQKYRGIADMVTDGMVGALAERDDVAVVTAPAAAPCPAKAPGMMPPWPDPAAHAAIARALAPDVVRIVTDEGRAGVALWPVA